jgi:hypothetical protein
MTPVESGTDADLRAIWGVGEAEASLFFAVGLDGAVLRWSEDVMAEEDSGMTTDLHGVWIEDEAASRVVAVGASGTVALRTEAGWEERRITRGDLLDVHGGPMGAFAVGEGGRAFVLEDADEGWRPLWTGTDATLRGVWVGVDEAGGPRVFAVGDGGTILELE